MFISLYNITYNMVYSPRDNFSPESEGSVNPKMEIQSREEITVCGMFTI